jgi:hypothetical protein
MRNDRGAVIAKAWRTTILRSIPVVLASLVAIHFIGLSWVMVALIGLLFVVLLYQRFINRRSWHSIMWGVYGPEKLASPKAPECHMPSRSSIKAIVAYALLLGVLLSAAGLAGDNKGFSTRELFKLISVALLSGFVLSTVFYVLQVAQERIVALIRSWLRSKN